MHLQRLKLAHFRNCTEAELLFCPRFNVLVGDNGMGKTNLLDAIHYLCVCKSHFSIPDSVALQQGADFFRLEGDFYWADQRTPVVCKYAANAKKVMECHKVAYKKLAEHIGLLPVVMIAPDDGQWLEESSENRRQLMDFTISQLNQQYLHHLNTYNQLLKQRNALLKQENGALDTALLAIYNEQMRPLAEAIFQQRQHWTIPLAEHFQRYYAELSEGKETVGIEYQSDLRKHSFEECMRLAYPRDVVLQRSTQGIHRDDWELSINGNSPLRRYASQGQRKSYLLALRLAQHALLRHLHADRSPLLLLDDVFDKLDQHRMRHLLELLSGSDFGQVFLTDTHPRRVADMLAEMGVEHRVLEVRAGEVHPL